LINNSFLEKNMNVFKASIVSFVIAAMVAPNFAMAEDNWVDVYGKIILSLDKVDEDNGDDQWELNSHASRFGVKGFGEAGDLEAFYQLEWEVDLADKSKGSEDNIKSRNQVVGIRGGFGEVFAGRHDTPTKRLQKKIDIFGDLDGDIKNSFNAENRLNNIVQYSTPKMNGFKAKLAFIPGEDSGNEDGIADSTSFALEFNSGNLNLGLSFDTDVDGINVDTARFVTQYNLDSWQFGFMYQDTDNEGVSGDGFMLSTKYKTGKHSLKLQLIESDSWEAGVSSKVKYTSQTSVGWDYKLGDKTTFFSYITLSEEGATEDEDSVFGFGLIQKF